MKCLKYPLLTGASTIAALIAASTAQAQITYSSTSSLTTWAGSPTYTSLANANLSGATTGQGDPTLTGSYGVMAETFTTASAFTLGSFDILLQVNNTASAYTVDLFDLGAAGTVSVSSSAATYSPGTAIFSDTVSLTTSAEVQGQFTLSGADQVSLLAGEEYALEILSPSTDGQNGVLWFRGSTADPGGQMFSNGNSASARLTLAGSGQAGGAPRTGALALYPAAVPEPTTLALIGGGLMAGLLIRRRK